jgi:hypothetical protein
MLQQPQHQSVNVEMLQYEPAGLSLPVPAHRARFCSTRSPCYASRTMERAAPGTETDIHGHS